MSFCMPHQNSSFPTKTLAIAVKQSHEEDISPVFIRAFPGQRRAFPRTERTLGFRHLRMRETGLLRKYSILCIDAKNGPRGLFS
jgi:hypothetical protein